MKEKNILPIGIFDSGVGGLTVLKAIHDALPNENLLYLGDTARLPYGTKSPETVTAYALQAATKLVQRGVKMLVIACNTATAAALPALRSAFYPLPVLGVIEPGAKAALAKTKNGHIAVIGTEGTIKGRAYHKALTLLCKNVRITGQACTLFVSLAEEGWIDGAVVEGVISKYLSHIFDGSSDTPDTLLLGCTHFPPFYSALKNVVGDNVYLVDSAQTTANAVCEALQECDFLHENNQGHCHFMTTDDAERFAKVGSLFLGHALSKDIIEHMDL